MVTYNEWTEDQTLATFVANVDAYTIKPGDYIAHNGYVICVEAIRPHDPRSPLSYRTVYGYWTEAPEGHRDVWIAGAHGDYLGTFRNEYPQHMREQLDLSPDPAKAPRAGETVARDEVAARRGYRKGGQ
jgi:hypothetical protein